ncbi:MAG TPA: hypothetical protein PLQ01_04795 [Methanothrix sp.]|nr:hypothetical protein [Methanothrix sp.]HOV81982.1 hypothetical protein [Methanothrix sp.]HRS85040.1 hypothetical protein [Methanothrix sp.]
MSPLQQHLPARPPCFDAESPQRPSAIKSALALCDCEPDVLAAMSSPFIPTFL